LSARRGIFVVFILLFIAVLASAGLMLLLVSAGNAPKPIPSNATLYLKIEAPFREIERSDLFTQFLRPPPTLRTMVDSIRKAARDSRVKTLVIMPQTAGALWAQLQEVRSALEEFRAGGKPITAYLEYGGAQEYYLATAANRVVMMPGGQLDLSGLATYELFFRGTFDKIGVYPDLLHIGEYKTASNTFKEKGFTPAHREMAQSLNRDWYDELVRRIALGRNRSEAEIRKTIDSGPFLAESARRAGLVDELAYEDQLDDKDPVRGTRRLESDDYEYASVRAAASSSRAPAVRMALLFAVGAIASGKSVFDTPGGSVVGSETFVQWVRKVRVDPGIRAIIVRIDSPGGSAIASEAIWRELMLARDVKPVIVSMGDVAASGGYYIAVPAHAIVAQPGTITGSIGVVTGKFVLKGTFDKLGMGSDSVSDGRFAEIYSPLRPFTAEERPKIEEQMQATYELFLSRVAEGRKSTAARIDPFAQGRVWTGRQAKERGLVDELGGLDDAIRLARQHAKLEATREVRLDVYPQRRSIYDVVANPFGSSMAAGLELLMRRTDLRGVELLTLARFRRGEPLALMPNVLLR
jgi:protease IV